MNNLRKLDPCFVIVRKVLVVIKSGEKNKPMDQDGRGGGRRDEKTQRK